MLGEVMRLLRYPVKSMLGEDVSVADVGLAGLHRDRALALLHATTGKVVSAKYPRLWRAMLLLRAGIGEGAGRGAATGPVRITFPDGRELLSTDPLISHHLSGFLGEPVTLTSARPQDAELDRAIPEAVLDDGVTAEVPATRVTLGGASPGGTFVDYAPLHLLTTATLGEIARNNDGRPVDPRRYRPNIIVRTAAAGFAENDWLGSELALGAELVLKIIARTPRCAVPTLQHGQDAGPDQAALRVLARHNRVMPLDGLAPEPCAGVYAQVLRPGRIEPGDAVFRIR